MKTLDHTYKNGSNIFSYPIKLLELSIYKTFNSVFYIELYPMEHYYIKGTSVLMISVASVSMNVIQFYIVFSNALLLLVYGENWKFGGKRSQTLK